MTGIELIAAAVCDEILSPESFKRIDKIGNFLNNRALIAAEIDRLQAMKGM